MAPTASVTPIPATHSSYERMIVRAIQAQNRATGSSRRSISKFITENYSGLSPNHDAQLTRQLRTLVRTGALYMVGNSYKVTVTIGASGTPAGASYTLARVSGTPAGASGRPRGRHRVNTAPENNAPALNLDHETAQAMLLAAQTIAASILKAQAMSTAVVTAKSGEKRKRGRPPTPRSESRAIVPRRGPGRPRKDNTKVVPMKRGLGRPQLLKRGPGHPKKVESVPTLENLRRSRSRQAEVENGPYRKKRKPGRPRKVPMVNKEETAYAVAQKAPVPYGEKRRPGRPRRVSVEPAVDKEVSVTSKGTVSTSAMPEDSGTHKHGRSKKILTNNAAEDEGPAIVKRGDSTPATGEVLENGETADKAVQEQGENIGVQNDAGASKVDTLATDNAAEHEGPAIVKRGDSTPATGEELENGETADKAVQKQCENTGVQNDAGASKVDTLATVECCRGQPSKYKDSTLTVGKETLIVGKELEIEGAPRSRLRSQSKEAK